MPLALLHKVLDVMWFTNLLCHPLWTLSCLLKWIELFQAVVLERQSSGTWAASSPPTAVSHLNKLLSSELRAHTAAAMSIRNEEPSKGDNLLRERRKETR